MKKGIKSKCLWRSLLFGVMLGGIAAMPVSADAAERLAVIEEVQEQSALSAGSYYNNISDAAEYLRSQMLQRNKNITVRISSKETDLQKILQEMLADAMEEDSTLPAAGDYLRQNYRGVSASAEYYEEGGVYNYTVKLSVEYYTNLSQENAVTAGVSNIIRSLKLTDTSDYGKIKAVYDYICSNIKYDHDSNAENTLSHTAYNAIYSGKAVCQGYTSLAYRMLRELNVPVRIVTGKSREQNHAWNIVKLNGYWYNIDCTWDATLSSGNDQRYEYFMKSMADFPDHVRDAEFQTAAFASKYPMSSTSYEKAQPILAKVTGVRASSVAATSVTLTWTRQAKAEGYRVYQYRPENNTYFTVGTINKNVNSCKISGLKAGSSYQFIVAAYRKGYGDNGVGIYSVPYKVVTAPAKASLSKLTTKSGTITAAWKKVASGKGYQIQYSTSKNFAAKSTKSVNVSKNTTVSKKIGSLKKKTQYYVRVRAYVKDGSTTRYGAWSNVKYIICK